MDCASMPQPITQCHCLGCRTLQVRCPVNINTGEFTKQLRTAAIEGLDPTAGAFSGSTSSSWGSKLSLFAANHFTLISRGAPVLLNTLDFIHGLLGPRVLEVVSGTLNRWTSNLVPQWNVYIPKASCRTRNYGRHKQYAGAGVPVAVIVAASFPKPACRVH